MTVHHARVVALAAVLVGCLSVPAAVQESKLKVTAPVPQSPTNEEIVGGATPTLTSTTAAGRFVSGTFEHHFEVWEIAVDGTTTLVETGTVAPTTARTTYTLRTALVNGGRYRWRVRAELAGFVGPWSVWATFRNVTTQANWTLLYAEDFSTPLNGAVAPWVWDGYSDPFDTVMDDSGLWYQNDYGPDWNTRLQLFRHLSQGVPGRSGRLADRLALGPGLGQGRCHRSPTVDQDPSAWRRVRGGAGRTRPHRWGDL